MACKAQLHTCYFCIFIIKLIITHSAPLPPVVDLQSTTGFIGTSTEPEGPVPNAPCMMYTCRSDIK